MYFKWAIYNQFGIIQNLLIKNHFKSTVFLNGSNEKIDSTPNIFWPHCWAGACDRGWRCMNSITRDYSQLSSFARSSCIAYSLHIRGGTVLQFLTLTAKRTDLLQHMQLCVQSIRSSLVLEHSLHLVKVLSLACPCSGTNISNQKIKCCLVLKWVVVPCFF